MLACGSPEPVAPPPPPSEPATPACDVARAGPFDAEPLGWVEGSTPEHAAWATASGFRSDGATVSGERSWVVHDELWVARAGQLERHPLDGGSARPPIDLAALVGGSPLLVDLGVVDVGGAVEGVWLGLDLPGEGDAPGGVLAHLVPDAPSAGWTLDGRFPAKGTDPVRYQAVDGNASRAVVAFEAQGRPGAQVVSRGAKPLRRLVLPVAREGGERAALGLVGQGVLTVAVDGHVLVDRPGHRHTESIPAPLQVSLGQEGLLAVDRDGVLHSRVRSGVRLVPGFDVSGPVLAAVTRGERAVAIQDVDGALEVVSGPVAPPVSGPTWARRAEPPSRCRVEGSLVLPPLLGHDGRLRLALRPRGAGEEAPAAPATWVEIVPPR